jgi:tetratricopeptide (TPR) repeat protein
MNQILKDMNKLNADSFTTDDLKKIASLDSVTHFLSGAVTKFGDKIRLNVFLQEAGSWKNIWADQQDGTENDMLDMVDLLTKKVKPQFNLTDEQIANDFDKAVADVTTPNQRALEFYIQAQRAFGDAEWNLAIDHFERAITLDPDFAMAYRFLGSVYNHLAIATGNQSYWDKFHEARQKSRDAAARRPPSERERLIIEGAYDDLPDSIDMIETFKKLLELYPDDVYGNSNLARQYYQLEAYDLAEKHIKRIVDFTYSPYPFYHLSNMYLHEGRFTETGELLERGLERFPNNVFLYQRLAKLHAMQLDFEKALYWCDRGFEVEPVQFRDYLVREDVLFFMDDFAAAEEEYRRCLDSQNNKARIDAAISLMQLYKTQGRYEESRMQAETSMQTLKKNKDADFDPINIELVRLHAENGNMEEALRLSKAVLDWPSQFKLQGEVYVQLKQRAEAEDMLLTIEDAIRNYDEGEWPIYLTQNDIEGPYRKRLRNALFSIKAMIAYENGDYSQVISFMEEAKNIYPGINLIPADLIDILGRAYYGSGDLKSAQEQFEWISRMTTNRKEYGDIYAKSFYMLGRIFEDLGSERKAMGNYEKFLDLWKNADPGLAEIEDARTRLAALQ